MDVGQQPAVPDVEDVRAVVAEDAVRESGVGRQAESPPPPVPPPRMPSAFEKV